MTKQKSKSKTSMYGETISSNAMLSSRFEFSCEEGFSETKKLTSYLGKEVGSSFATDKGTKQYLIGLKYTTGIEGYSRYWVAKIRFTCNGRNEERWINVRGVKIQNRR